MQLLLTAGCDERATGPGIADPVLGIGYACDGDADCPNDTFCLLPDAGELFGGGPPAGLCVADCTGAPEACDAYIGATCADVGTDSAVTSLCLRACELDTSGCGLVDGAVCAPDDDAGAYCRPLCTSDADCPGDLRCDIRDSVCMADPPARGVDFGLPCDDAPGGSCQGVCGEVMGAGPFCSQRCAFGDTASCGDLRSGGRAGGCLLSTGGIGDLGLCAPLCDCNDDCPAGAPICDPLGSETLTDAFGAAGLCVAEGLVMGEPIVCDAE